MLLYIFPSTISLAGYPIPTAPKLMVCLYHSYALKISTPQEVLFENFKSSIGALIVEKSLADRFSGLKPVSLTANIGILG